MIEYLCASNLKVYIQQSLVEGVLQARSISIICGKDGDKNGLVATELAFSVATGKSYHNRHVNGQRTVLYITVDSNSTFANHVKSWEEANDITLNNKFFVCSSPINLVDENQLDQLLNDIYHNNHLGGNEIPELIVLDIQGGLMGNNTQEEYLNELKNSIYCLRDEIGAAILLVFNKGISEYDSKYMSLFNTAEAIHVVEANQTDSLVRLNCIKMIGLALPEALDIDINCLKPSAGKWS